MTLEEKPNIALKKGEQKHFQSKLFIGMQEPFEGNLTPMNKLRGLFVRSSLHCTCSCQYLVRQLLQQQHWNVPDTCQRCKQVLGKEQAVVCNLCTPVLVCHNSKSSCWEFCYFRRTPVSQVLDL